MEIKKLIDGITYIADTEEHIAILVAGKKSKNSEIMRSSVYNSNQFAEEYPNGHVGHYRYTSGKGDMTVRFFENAEAFDTYRYGN